MAPHQLVIAPAAQNDLKGIYQYGLQQWELAQSEKYLATIKNQFRLLTDQLLMGTERNESARSQKPFHRKPHPVLLCYRVTTNTVEIIRILHGRQDSQRHMK